MNISVFVFRKIIFECGAVGIGIFKISFRSGESVAEHFLDIDERHRRNVNEIAFPIKFNPVFEVVFISAFMVEPHGGITFIVAFGDGGTSFAVGEIFHAAEKFGERKFT